MTLATLVEASIHDFANYTFYRGAINKKKIFTYSSIVWLLGVDGSSRMILIFFLILIS